MLRTALRGLVVISFVLAANSCDAFAYTVTPTSTPCLDGLVAPALRDARDAAPSDLKTLSDGTTVRTTYLPDAAYAVMRCAPSGALLHAVTYERRPTPTGTQYLLTQDTYPAGDGLTTATPEWPAAGDKNWAAIWPTSRKAMEAARWLPNSSDRLTVATNVSATASAAKVTHRRAQLRSGTVNYQCTNSYYNLIADAATGTRRSAWPYHGYPIYTAMPSALLRNRALNGYAAWDNTWNICGFGDGDKTQSWWAGDVGAWSNATDGANYLGGWSNPGMSCGSATSGVLGCTYSHGTWLTTAGPGGQNVRNSDADTFFNFYYCFTVGQVPGCYDLQSVATHEAGHAYGLMHVGSCCSDDYDDDLVMFPTTSDNDMTHRNLALGDIYGLGQFYPY